MQGESGIGKSSFVAKIRSDANERKNKNRVFVYAVDVRAANDLTYIDLAFLNCLKAAQRAGFGVAGELMLSNSQDPLSSNSVISFLKACEKKKQVVVLIFDQFEELYSKIEMYDVFNEAKRLFLATVSAKLNFALGFAWKTDCSIPQDHPAYHFWQSLSDHRYAITLRPFAQEDAIESLSLFEKEIGESLRPDVRKYLLDNCQGLPWLLKKLCIHLLDTMARGASQRDMENEGLDIAHLFDQDIDMLSPEELQALKLIAANAPMDWFEAMQTVSNESIKALQNKRLILNKGKKLNLYWDIFREYVLNKTVPDVPFVYIPQGPSIDGVIKAGKILSLNKAITADEISEEIHFSKKTTWNILTDLVRFGIAKSKNGLYRLEANVDNRDEMSLLRFLRGAVRRHKVLSELRKVYTKKPCTIEQFTELMASCIPPGHYTAHTLNVYSQKLRNWFSRLGYTRICGAELSFEDRGDVMAEGEIRFYHVNDHVFIGDVSPKLAVEILSEIALRTRDVVSLRKFSGWRNAIGMLMRLGLIEKTGTESFKATFSVSTKEGVVEKLFVHAAKEYSIQCSISMLQRSENASAMEIGKAVARQVNRDWKNASALRVGGSLRLWARWILESEKCKKILPPPGYRIKKESNQLMMDFGLK